MPNNHRSQRNNSGRASRGVRNRNRTLSEETTQIAGMTVTIVRKAIKNMYASEYIWNSIKYDKPVGVIAEDKEQGLVSIAEPVGVICGVTPTTNPTSITIFKALIAL